MNIKEYISSGIVESYVLGLASEQERTEFEQLCAKYPELVEARTNFELLLEKQAMENAEAPPADSKKKIWSVIQEIPAANPSKIISMEPTITRRSSGMRWLAAASIVLMLVAGYFAYDLNNKNKRLESSNTAMQRSLDSTKTELDRIAGAKDMPDAKDMTVVNMVATEKAPPSEARVYWDSTSSNVWLVVKNMPKLPSDKQYQLWAFIDGKPTDLGLFDMKEDKFILQMKGAKNASAFAITIENRGNIGGPNTEQLQSQGKPKL